MEIPDNAHNMSPTTPLDEPSTEPVRYHDVFRSLDKLSETVKQLIAERDAALSDVKRLTAAHTLWQQNALDLEAKNKKLLEELHAMRAAVHDANLHC